MLKIATDGGIIINGSDTGLKVSQTRDKTIVYSPALPAIGPAFRCEKLCIGRNADGKMMWEDAVLKYTHIGQKYKEYPMPELRYSTAHPKPLSGVAGSRKFEADVLNLLAGLTKQGFKL